MLPTGAPDYTIWLNDLISLMGRRGTARFIEEAAIKAWKTARIQAPSRLQA